MSSIYSSEGRKAWLPKIHREQQTPNTVLPPWAFRAFLSYFLKLQNEPLILPRDPGSAVCT